jgi:hypothetical protein
MVALLGPLDRMQPDGDGPGCADEGRGQETRLISIDGYAVSPHEVPAGDDPYHDQIECDDGDNPPVHHDHIPDFRRSEGYTDVIAMDFAAVNRRGTFHSKV